VKQQHCSACSRPLEQKLGPGRSRKFCLTCRPNRAGVACTSTCAYCGLEFEQRQRAGRGGSYRKHCSDACRRAAATASHRRRNNSARGVRTCLECGKQWPADGHMRRFCSREHRVAWYARGRKPARPTEVRVCAACGGSFVPVGCDKRTCSSSCGIEWAKIKKRRDRAEGRAPDRRKGRDRRAYRLAWLATHPKKVAAYAARSAAREREITSMRRNEYPGAHLPSIADAVRAGALCAGCRAARPAEGKRQCDPCLEVARQNRARWYEQKKVQGVCVVCGQRRPTEGAICDPCAQRECRTEASMVRRCRDLGAKGEHTGAAWRARFALFGYRCAWCGAVGKLHRDHVIPLAQGGTNWAANIVPACRACNLSKSDRDPNEFARSRMRQGLPITRYALRIAKHFRIMMANPSRPGGNLPRSACSDGVSETRKEIQS
jgi:5-methylcytosine-specific restriction endonuclease McrA